MGKARKLYVLRKYCKYCGATENLTIDHKHPVSLGGTDDLSNLQTLCYDCNSLKSNIPHETFVKIMHHGIYCFIKRQGYNKRLK
jgi:5-methylcytosine-specific restriction endonuclease McrA